MKDVTPQAMRCGSGGCPAIIEMTPADMRCVAMTSCPALFELGADDGAVAVIGKIAPPEVATMLAGRVGPDETVVLVPRQLLVGIQWSEPASAPPLRGAQPRG
jgi:hypothetical protein